VDPEILECFLAGDTIDTIRQRAAGQIDRALSEIKTEEAAVLMLIQKRLRKANRARS
jgi:DNA topoisomerase-1